MRTAAPFELPGWYFGTTRLIIRLVVQLTIRLVVNYQLQADNPADNQAVTFVMHYKNKTLSWLVSYIILIWCHFSSTKI